jgi:hypothetical protein
MCDGIINQSATETRAEIWHERVNPDAFARLGVAMQGLEGKSTPLCNLREARATA